MSLGERRDRVIFQTATISGDAFGEPDQTWEDVCTSWAKVIAIKGAERFQSQQVTAEVDYRIVTRNRSELSNLAPDDRITWNGHTFDIRAVIPRGYGNGDLEILAKEHL